MLHLELLIQGLIHGSMYAIIAVGLTLVYGLLRILHVAHAGLLASDSSVWSADGRLLATSSVQALFRPAKRR